MQTQGAADPARTFDPAEPPAPAASVPAAANPGNIPEMGIAGGKPSGPSGKLGTPEDRSTQFIAVQGGGDTTSSEALLVSAYLVMWALLLVFVWFTWRRQQKMDDRVTDLERALEGTRAAPAPRES
ncbi:MAG TPA: hypothetical protein VK524_20660 [Polyangiaceae bacterium]|nr:hypothetical protein [Polyangiaceae bacterium]